MLDLVSALVGEGEGKRHLLVADIGDGDTAKLEALDPMHVSQANAAGRRAGLRHPAGLSARIPEPFFDGIEVTVDARRDGDVFFFHAVLDPPVHLLDEGVDFGASALSPLQCRLGAVHKGVVAGEVMGVFAFVQVVVGMGAE